jgi:hypothetical protein
MQCRRNECVKVYLYSTVIKQFIYFIAALRQSGVHQFQAVTSGNCVIAGVTSCTTTFIHPKYIHTSSKRIYVLYMVLRIKRQYFPVQHYVVRYYNRDGESLTDLRI